MFLDLIRNPCHALKRTPLRCVPATETPVLGAEMTFELAAEQVKLDASSVNPARLTGPIDKLQFNESQSRQTQIARI